MVKKLFIVVVIFIIGIVIYFYRKIQTAKRLGFAVAKIPHDIQVDWKNEVVTWTHNIVVTNGDTQSVNIQAINLQVFTPYQNGTQLHYIGNAILNEPAKILDQNTTNIKVKIVAGLTDLGLGVWRIITGLVQYRIVKIRMVGEIKAEGVFISFDETEEIDFSKSSK